MNDRLGVVLPTRYDEPLERYVELVERAESQGFATAWFTEVAGADAIALASAAALRTERITLATGVVPITTRSAPLIAMGAATLQDLSGGRALLGIGTSTPTVIGRWHGLPFDAPATRLAETIAAVRAVFAGQPAYAGARVRTTGFHLGLTAPMMPPIHVAALGPRTLRLAGRIADGALLTLASCDHLARMGAVLRESARAAGTRGRLVAYVRVAVTERPEAARAWMRDELAWYASSAAYRAHFRRQGWFAEMEVAAYAWEHGDKAAAAAAMSPSMCAALICAGSPATVRADLSKLLDIGVDEVACYFVDVDGRGVDGLAEQLDRLAAG